MFKFVAASLLAFAALVVAQADPSINTPASLVECQPVQLSWTASKEPVFIAVIPGGQPGAAPLKDFGQQAPGTKTLTWKVNFPGGTSVTMQIKDATGAVAYSGNMNIQEGSDSSCVNFDATIPSGPSSSAAGSQSAPAASSAPAGTSRPAAGTTPAGGATHPAASSTRAPAAATSATPTSGSAAASNAALPGAQIGWTGLMGVLAALIVA